MHKMLILTHIEITKTMSTVYTTLEYEYWHENKGIDLILESKDCGVYKWDQKKLQDMYSTDLHYHKMLILIYTQVTNTKSK